MGINVLKNYEFLYFLEYFGFFKVVNFFMLVFLILIKDNTKYYFNIKYVKFYFYLFFWLLEKEFGRRYDRIWMSNCLV